MGTGAEAELIPNRCDQCRFWGKGVDGPGWEGASIGFNVCERVRARWLIEDEASAVDSDDTDKWIATRKNALKSAKAYVQDGSEYMAELITGPDFFCALWEAK